jgi:hypothetical protein
MSRILILCLFVCTHAFGQRVFFNSYDRNTNKYALCIWEKDSVKKYEGIFLGERWKMFGETPYGFTTNSIYKIEFNRTDDQKIKLYSTAGFIQDFDVTEKAIFTIEASEEQFLDVDGQCFRIDKKSNTRTPVKQLAGKNIFAIQASPFSEMLIVIEKMDSGLVLGIYDEKQSKYNPIQTFKHTDFWSPDLNMHNHAVWINPSKIAVLVKDQKTGEFEVWEYDLLSGLKNIRKTGTKPMVDFDFCDGVYYFITKGSEIFSLDETIKFRLVDTGDLKLISGFRVKRN